MFVLRRITSEGNESNSVLGDNYHLVQKNENPAEYQKVLLAWSRGLEVDDEEIYGFIDYQGGQIITPLYKKSIYFIMMSNGQTFANISHK